MKNAILKIDSPVGPLYLKATDSALIGIYFHKPIGQEMTDLEEFGSEKKVLKKAVRQLEEYFAGRRREFDLPIEAEGTVFQKKVWRELAKIPYGKTCSYRDIARKIKNEKAVRAVGTANGRNPLSIVVPCHRVIAADGTLGGYGGGLTVKTKLLEIENGAPS